MAKKPKRMESNASGNSDVLSAIQVLASKHDKTLQNILTIKITTEATAKQIKCLNATVQHLFLDAGIHKEALNQLESELHRLRGIAENKCTGMQTLQLKVDSKVTRCCRKRWGRYPECGHQHLGKGYFRNRRQNSEQHWRRSSFGSEAGWWNGQINHNSFFFTTYPGCHLECCQMLQMFDWEQTASFWATVSGG